MEEDKPSGVTSRVEREAITHCVSNRLLDDLWVPRFDISLDPSDLLLKLGLDHQNALATPRDGEVGRPAVRVWFHGEVDFLVDSDPLRCLLEIWEKEAGDEITLGYEVRW